MEIYYPEKKSEFPYGEVLGKYDFSWGNKFSYFPSPSCNYCIMFLQKLYIMNTSKIVVY